ncbi:MAG: hypothetical protein JW844_03730 [Candidatus Omnitrophica bacterium]|nr:hypothetical protein [Candidatus Omnitrophota bacterium]
MKRLVLNDKGMSIMITVFIMLTLSTMAFVAGSCFVVDTHMAEDTYKATQALFLAEAGIQCALEEQLDSDSNWSDVTDFSRSLGPGSFSVEFANVSSHSVDVESTGTYGETSRTVVQSFVLTPGAPPEAFNYAIHAGNNINMSNTDGLLEGDVSSGSGSVHMGEIDVDGDIEPSSGVPLPTVDFTGYYNDAPSTQRITGDYTFLSGGSYNGVWYITGNATVESWVTINGTIIAEGNIDLGQSSGITIDPVDNYPALISRGNINANQLSSSTIQGLVYAALNVNNVIMNNLSGVTFLGTIIAGNNLNMNSAEDITCIYDPAIVTNPPPHFIGGTDTISSAQWKEEY